MKRYWYFMPALLFFGGAAAAGGKLMEHKKLSSTKTVNEKLLRQLCAPPFHVTVMKDKEGNIGGYRVNRTDVMDAPVQYYDAHGRPFAAFHIFAPDAEKKEAGLQIDRLTSNFPLDESVDCSKFRNSP